MDRTIALPISPYPEKAPRACTHCRAMVENPIEWHDHYFHIACARKLLIVAQMTKDELVRALEMATS